MKRLTLVTLIVLVLFGSFLYAQEIRRPSADADDTTISCTGTLRSLGANTFGAAYDASGGSTAANLNLNGPLSTATWKNSHAITSWQAASGTYSSLSLKVDSSCTVQQPSPTGTSCKLVYSTNSGTTWTTLRSTSTNWARVTDTINLSATQSLSAVKLGICVSAKGSTNPDIDPGMVDLSIWDVRTEGVLAATPPAAPSNLQSSAAANGTSVNLTWNDNSNNETGFKIERCQGSGCTNFAWLADATANATSASTSTAACTTYVYRVYAYNSSGNSGYSNTSQVSTPCAPSSGPAGLAVSNPDSGGVTLTWTPGTGQTSQSIERCTGTSCSNFSEISTTTAPATTANDNTVSFTNTYRYRVRGVNAVGYSGYSNIVDVVITNGTYSLTTPWTTIYKYDTVGNLTCVEQHGNIASASVTCANPADGTYGGDWRVRKFKYDSLSQLTEARNPESGVISYTYDNDGSITTKVSPAPNQYDPNLTQTIKNCYDNLHQLKGKYYAASGDCNTGFAVQYGYDEATLPGGYVVENGVGHRTSMTDSSGTTAWSYDLMGRLKAEHRTIAGITKDFTYDYNPDDSAKTLLYPSGSVLNFDYDAAGRLLNAKDVGNNINYATSAFYSGSSNLLTMTIGSSAGFGGYTEDDTYNNRLQPTKLSVLKPGAVAALRRYYDYGTTGQNNGNVATVTDDLDGNRTLSYTYDGLNRIKTAQSALTDCSAVPTNPSITKNWGNRYTVDPWGNLAAKDPTKCTTESLSAASDTNNRIVGFCYDAAGNLLKQGACGTSDYVYDAENRITTTAGSTYYVYDGDGVRVKKSGGSSSPTLYWGESFTGGPITETDLAGVIKAEYVYFGSTRIARRDLPSGAVHYYFSDHLKSVNLVYDANGNKEEDSDFYPYGGERGYTLGTGNHFKFTGKERDSESGLDYFGARYYGNSLGRFLTPDWPSDDTVPAAIPYAELSDPQSINLYSYVRNNPNNYADPDGHLYVICTSEGKDQERCTTISNQAYYEATQGDNPGISAPSFGNSGNITCNGEVCGTATYYDEGQVNDLSGEQLGGLVIGGVFARIAEPFVGRVASLFGRVTGEAAGSKAETTAAKVLVSGTKAAVKDAVEKGLVSEAQKAAVKRALARAAASNNVTVEALGDGSIRVVTEVAGRAGGRATYEKVIDAAGNTIADSVVQKAYARSGDLVHVDPKGPK